MYHIHQYCGHLLSRHGCFQLTRKGLVLSHPYRTTTQMHVELSLIHCSNSGALDRHDRRQFPIFTCTLSMSDSATTAGWLRKSKFREEEDYILLKRETSRLARKNAARYMTRRIRDYPQWFPGDENWLTSSLFCSHNLTDAELTHFVTSIPQSQTPVTFSFHLLPTEIRSNIFSLMRVLQDIL